MKILKLGKIKSPKNTITCYNCDSELKYDDSDIRTDKDGTYIKCPLCKKFLNIK
jgi:DNA-directed RNA polymerase subunit RPC12/RpoP